MNYTELRNALEDFCDAFMRLDREWEQAALDAESKGQEDGLTRIMNNDYPFIHPQGENFTDLADHVQDWCHESIKAMSKKGA